MSKVRANTILSLMGRKVVVSKRLQRTWPEDNTKTPITWESDDLKPRTGWIVGLRYLQTGLRDPGWSVKNIWSDDGPEYERPSLKQTAPPTPALMVCFWPTTKPIFVPLNGYREWQEGDSEPFACEFWIPADQYRQVLREAMREEMKDWPREKGRWIKKTAVHPYAQA